MPISVRMWPSQYLSVCGLVCVCLSVFTTDSVDASLAGCLWPSQINVAVLAINSCVFNNFSLFKPAKCKHNLN